MCEVIYEGEKRQGNSPGIELLESPSSSDHLVSLNRRNLRRSSSEKVRALELECEKLRTEVATLKAAALQSEAIHNEMREFYEKGRELNEKERKLSSAKISGLEKQLEEQIQEARLAQRAAEIELHRLKLQLMGYMKSEALVTSSRCQGDTDSQSDMKSEFGDRSDGTAKLEDDSTSLPGFILQQVEIEGDGSRVQGGTGVLGLEAPSADQSIDTAEGEIEEELTGESQEGMEHERPEESQEVIEQEETGESSSQAQKHQLKNPGIPQLPLQLRVCLCRHKILVSRQEKEDLRENVIEKVSSLPSEGFKGWDGGSSVVDPKWSSFFSKIDHSGGQIPDPSDNGSCSGHPRADDDDDDESDDGDSARTRRVRYTQLNVGKHHSVLVPRRFLRINWQQYFRKLEKGRWICITCDRTFSHRTRAVDHVWSAHHGERFKCLHCDKSFTIREKIKEHTERRHRHSL